MKNLKETAERSRRGTKIYYSIKEAAIYTAPGNGRHYVTELLRKNTEKEIETAVRRWLYM